MPAQKVTTTLQDALTRMMMNSDNRTTRTFQVRYGYPTLNAFVDGLGMANTELRQILGCGFQNGLRNDFTLVDAGKLYESVVNGTQLSGTSRTNFWNMMVGGGVTSSSAIGQIVVAEGERARDDRGQAQLVPRADGDPLEGRELRHLRDELQPVHLHPHGRRPDHDPEQGPDRRRPSSTTTSTAASPTGSRSRAR